MTAMGMNRAPHPPRRAVAPRGATCRQRRSQAAWAAPRLILAAWVAATTIGCSTTTPAGERTPLWTPPAGAIPINVSVRFTGTQFVVENRTSDLWRDVGVAVGRDGDPPAYSYRAEAILGARSVTVGALNFARPDGTRLSPFRLQPDRWSVVATLPSGTLGFGEGRFD